MKQLIAITTTLCTCLLLLGIALNAGCKKNTDACAGVTGGGKGGNATITIVPEHAGSFVDSCKVYIKYGTKDVPANGRYDDSAWCTLHDTIPVATFSNLTVGQYYLFADGYHPPYSPPFVRGGAGFSVCDERVVSDTLPTFEYNK